MSSSSRADKEPVKFNKLTAAEAEKFNKMTFEEFDQDEKNGVRSLVDKGDFEKAGEATISYMATNNDKLTPAQRCLIWFHAGQNAAFANRNNDAIKFFEKASETVPDEKTPNKIKYPLAEFIGPATEFYLKASIAFIKHQVDPTDRESTRVMHEALKEVEKIPLEVYPLESNVVFIPCRINYMCNAPSGTPYLAIIQSPPIFPPLKEGGKWEKIPEGPEPFGKRVDDYRIERILRIDQMKRESAAPKDDSQPPAPSANSPRR
jgi:hypothetical protein